MTWDALEFSLHKLENNIASKRSSMIDRYLDIKSEPLSQGSPTFVKLRANSWVPINAKGY